MLRKTTFLAKRCSRRKALFKKNPFKKTLFFIDSIPPCVQASKAGIQNKPLFRWLWNIFSFLRLFFLPGRSILRDLIFKAEQVSRTLV
jgi:hypothetical protein